MIDQTLLPGELVMLDLRTVEGVCEAILALRVRGAPAIGCAAALGLALAALISPERVRNRVLREAREQLAEVLKA
jgi:methylthioribose-1-phosphate isomerase